MTIGRMQVKTGMEIVGSDGGHIGHVKEVRDTDFLVSRPMARDIYVPFSAVRSCSETRCELNIPADQVDSMGWMSPPLGGSRY